MWCGDIRGVEIEEDWGKYTSLWDSGFCCSLCGWCAIVVGILFPSPDVVTDEFSSVCKLTVSNALLMSRAIASVRCGGLFWLKPVVIMLFIVCNAVVVECCVRKPC